MIEKEKNLNIELKKAKEKLRTYKLCNKMANFMLLVQIPIAAIVIGIILVTRNINFFVPLIIPIMSTAIWGTAKIVFKIKVKKLEKRVSKIELKLEEQTSDIALETNLSRNNTIERKQKHSFTPIKPKSMDTGSETNYVSKKLAKKPNDAKNIHKGE